MADPTPIKQTQNGSFGAVPIEIVVAVGQARPTVRDLMDLTANSVLILDRRIDDPVELFVGDKLIARGELQEIEGGEAGQLGVRITELAEGTNLS